MATKSFNEISPGVKTALLFGQLAGIAAGISTGLLPVTVGAAMIPPALLMTAQSRRAAKSPLPKGTVAVLAPDPAPAPALRPRPRR